MEYGENGVLEYWSGAVMSFRKSETQYSITPVLHFPSLSLLLAAVVC